MNNGAVNISGAGHHLTHYPCQVCGGEVSTLPPLSSRPPQPSSAFSPASVCVGIQMYLNVCVSLQHKQSHSLHTSSSGLSYSLPLNDGLINYGCLILLNSYWNSTVWMYQFLFNCCPLDGYSGCFLPFASSTSAIKTISVMILSSYMRQSVRKTASFLLLKR